MPYRKLAQILRTDADVLLELEEKLEALTGKNGIMEKIVNENEILVKRTLEEFGLQQNCSAEEIEQALIGRITYFDKALYSFLGKPNLAFSAPQCGQLCESVLGVYRPPRGFFLKKEKAAQMLEQFPPPHILADLGYKDVHELLNHEDLLSVFSALRFAEDANWMEQFFDKTYDQLVAGDFEERDIEMRVLEPKWLKIAEKYLEHKHHNVSHLKELGIVFIMPLAIDSQGETLRLFTLLLHYLFEITFYTGLFRSFAQLPDFTSRLKSLLRGDVITGPLPDHGKISFRIVQRYLAKDDPQDPRLFEPHVNPEAMHWYRAEHAITTLKLLKDGERHNLGFWQGLDFVGDFFTNTHGKSALISFDLVDLTLSIFQDTTGTKKLIYHQQEALWNKIFIEYLGEDAFIRLIGDNIINGFITL